MEYGTPSVRVSILERRSLVCASWPGLRGRGGAGEEDELLVVMRVRGREGLESLVV